MIIVILVDCGHPTPPENGNLGNYSETAEGANVTFRCNQDFVPVAEMVSICSSDGVWEPAPELHNCTAGIARHDAWCDSGLCSVRIAFNLQTRLAVSIL